MDNINTILMVEDSESDAALAFEALSHDGSLDGQIHRVKDGDEALRYLFRQGEHNAAIRPSLVLLDMNMPGTDGREVLRQVREATSTCDLPVIVMTSSSYDAEMLTAQGLEADAYIVKPVALNNLKEAIRSMQSLAS